MKRIVCFIMLTVLLLSVFSITALADDNAQGGSGNAQNAVTGYGWYNTYEYLWKVTLFVGKSDQATKQSNLVNDFHRIGTVVMKKTDWTVSSSVKFGSGIKVDYYSGAAMTMNTSPHIVSDSNCPKVPIACGGNIETVKSYFGSTGTMTTVLNAIASRKGTTKESMLNSLSFTIGGRTKTGWGYDYVAPNGTSNRVPWVIVYEPMVVMHLKDKVTQLAFTATEFALCEINGWYDWDYSNGAGQRVNLLTDYHLPTSVQLEESWFGYPVYAVTDGSKRWAYADTVKGGGWGMRWLSAAVVEPVYSEIDYGVYFGIVETPNADSYGDVTVYWRNYKSKSGMAFCELYRGSTLVWSGYQNLSGGGLITSTISVYYPGSSSQVLTARINYANRNSETDPNDNLVSRTVSPTPTVDDTYDFSVSGLTVTPSTVYQGDYVTVSFISDNWNLDVAYNDILVEVLVGNTVVKSEYVDFVAYGRNHHTYSIPITAEGTPAVTVRINWFNRYQEENSGNNSTSMTVIANKNYEFSISNLNVDPVTCYENDTVTVSFRTDSWDFYNAYEDIPIELLYNGSVIYTEYVDYAAYAGKNHTLSVNVGETAGVNDLSVRINWPDHTSELNPNNNESTSVSITVKSKVDLTIEAIIPNSDYRAGITVVTSYRIYNNSSHDIIPSHNNTVAFEVYYYENEEKHIIATQTWNQAVIPANDNNLVYFKWTVPASAVGKNLGCKAVVNSGNTVEEFDTTNNTALLTQTVSLIPFSQTPDTQYEETKPNGFAIPSAPSISAGSATWSLWTYSNGNFVKKNYGVAISSTAPTITPDEDNPSAKYTSGQWQMRSGYSIYMSYAPGITSISGYTMPASSAYTSVQRVEAAFPEFKYAKTIGSFRSLEKYSGVWVFVRNTSADLSERLHFTPLWYPNGNYIVSVMATDVWTPAGMISSVRNSNTIKIVDSAYDDWYVGEG